MKQKLSIKETKIHLHSQSQLQIFAALIPFATTLIPIVLGFFLWTSAAAQAAQKIGYVDVDRALLATKEGRRVDESLKKTTEAKRKELVKKETAIQKMMKALDQQRPVLSKEAFAKKRSTVQKEMKNFQEFAENSQRELHKKRDNLLQPLVSKMEAMIQRVATKSNYTMVLRKSPQVILWANNKGDLTDKVIKEFEKQSKKSTKR